VKKVIFAVMLVACMVTVAVAADHANSVARPGVVAGSKMPAHPFVHTKAIEAAATKIIISDAADDVVNVYNTSGHELAQLTGFSLPQGLATDAKGTLYVADTENSRIQVYTSPYKKAPKTLSDSGQYPAGVSVFNNGEYVAVTNIISTSDGPGSVTIYKNGKAGSPISNSDFARVYFCAFDKSGNLYVDGENSSGDFQVGEIAKVTKGGTKWTTLTIGNSIEFPGGVQVTTKGLIAIDDQEAATVYSYNPPKKGSLGSPVDTTAITGSSDAVTFAFTSTNTDLWTADASNANSAEYAYPKGGSAITTISVGGEPIGAAVVPAEIP